MPKTSAGIFLYRKREEMYEVLLVHPGGPFWKNKEEGAWSIPKGEAENGEVTDEELCTLAKREFSEELGCPLPDGSLFYLGFVKQKSGKAVHAWALLGDIDTSNIKSNTVKIEWPPRSGKNIEIPEVDRVSFFSIEEAKEKINTSQAIFLDRFLEIRK